MYFMYLWIILFYFIFFFFLLLLFLSIFEKLFAKFTKYSVLGSFEWWFSFSIMQRDTRLFTRLDLITITGRLVQQKNG